MSSSWRWRDGGADPHRTLLVQVDHQGGRYLVSLAGESGWVRNVRSAAGRATASRARRWGRAARRASSRPAGGGHPRLCPPSQPSRPGPWSESGSPALLRDRARFLDRADRRHRRHLSGLPASRRAAPRTPVRRPGPAAPRRPVAHPPGLAHRPGDARHGLGRGPRTDRCAPRARCGRRTGSGAADRPSGRAGPTVPPLRRRPSCGWLRGAAARSGSTIGVRHPAACPGSACPRGTDLSHLRDLALDGRDPVPWTAPPCRRFVTGLGGGRARAGRRHPSRRLRTGSVASRSWARSPILELPRRHGPKPRCRPAERSPRRHGHNAGTPHATPGGWTVLARSLIGDGWAACPACWPHVPPAEHRIAADRRRVDRACPARQARRARTWGHGQRRHSRRDRGRVGSGAGRPR